jgi:GNAT superfamily N-acetyltransferase
VATGIGLTAVRMKACAAILEFVLTSRVSSQFLFTTHHYLRGSESPPRVKAETMIHGIDENETSHAPPAVDALRVDSIITIRPVGVTDADAYRDVLDRTSEEDRYCRFFHVVNHFDLSEIKRFVEPRSDTVGFIAEDGSTALGVAHAFFTADTSAEIAIVVAADARCRGVGRALLERLIDVLIERGHSDVRAFSLSGNNAFGHLARAVGMTPVGSAGDMMTTWALAAPAP